MALPSRTGPICLRLKSSLMAAVAAAGRRPRSCGSSRRLWTTERASRWLLAETVIGLFKTEVIHRRGPWRSLEDVEFAILEWVDWFNNRRLLEPIGNIPPAEEEAHFYSDTEELAMVA